MVSDLLLKHPVRVAVTLGSERSKVKLAGYGCVCVCRRRRDGEREVAADERRSAGRRLGRSGSVHCRPRPLSRLPGLLGRRRANEAGRHAAEPPPRVATR